MVSVIIPISQIGKRRWRAVKPHVTHQGLRYKLKNFASNSTLENTSLSFCCYFGEETAGHLFLKLMDTNCVIDSVQRGVLMHVYSAGCLKQAG